MPFGPDLRSYSAQVVKSCLVKDLPAPADEYVLEAKLDGFRLISHVTPDGCDTWTRSLKLQNGKIPYIDVELRDIFPPGTVVDGEICALYELGDGVINDFEWVQSVMLSKPERARQRALDGRPLDYVIFDIMYSGGQDLRYHDFRARRQILESLFAFAGDTKRVRLIDQAPATQAYHDGLVAMGYEGTIAKHLEMPYRSGSRGAKVKENGRGMYKLKTQTEIDAVLVDIKPGTPGSEFDSMVGALVFGTPASLAPPELNTQRVERRAIADVEYIVRGACSGFTLDERKRLTKLWKDDPGALIGQLLAVNHMGAYPDGITFRHPQLSRWRPDKHENELTWM